VEDNGPISVPNGGKKKRKIGQLALAWTAPMTARQSDPSQFAMLPSYSGPSMRHAFGQPPQALRRAAKIGAASR